MVIVTSFTCSHCDVVMRAISLTSYTHVQDKHQSDWLFCFCHFSPREEISVIYRISFGYAARGSACALSLVARQTREKGLLLICGLDQC